MRPAQGYMEQPPMQPVPGGSEKHPLPPHQAYPVNLPQFKEGFQHGLCGCCNDCSTCCLGCWCPCILFGRTRARLLNPHLRKEQISCWNGDCMGYAALATLCPGLQFIFGCMNRKDIRKKYDIDGNGCSDCMVHWCCDCCVSPFWFVWTDNRR